MISNCLMNNNNLAEDRLQIFRKFKNKIKLDN